MKTIIKWFINNPVAANLLMVFILVAGGLTIYGLRTEGFPKIPADSISVSVVMPGADVKQVDEGIVKKVERSVKSVPGIKNITSVAGDSIAVVTIKKTSGYDLDRLMDDVKTKVDSIDLPRIAERPIISRDEYKYPALIVQVYGDADQDVLQRTAKMVEDELLARPEITKIRQWGAKIPAINIELVPHKLEQYHLSSMDVASAIRESSLEYKVGEIKAESGRIQVTADGKAYRYQDFANIPIKQLSNGTVLYLADIADIEDGYEKIDGEVAYQGKPAIGMELVIEQKGNILDLSNAAHKVVDSMASRIPDDVSVEIWADQSGFVADRLDLLKSNAFQGLLLVFVLLALFLNLKLAFWVAMGIPIAISGTVAVMGLDYFDYSLNDITTFGMIVVLGILVDDAVVVGESVHTEQEKSHDPIESTYKGVVKVSVATIFGVMTTIAAFYPLLMIDNPLGKLLAGFSAIVIIALLFSLLESKLILPSHLVSSGTKTKEHTNRIQRFWQALQARINGALMWFNYQCYRKLLKKALIFRYATITLMIGVAALIISLLWSGTIRSVFFPDIPGNIITVNMEMYPNSPYKLTLENAEKLESEARKVSEIIMTENNMETQPIVRLMKVVNSSESVEIYAELSSVDQRDIGILEIIKRWRESVGTLEGVRKINYTGSEDAGGGFAIRIFSNDEQQLSLAAEELRQAIADMEGINDVRNDLQSKEKELVVIPKPNAGYLGVSKGHLAVQIGDAFGGLEIQRMQRNADELRVMMRYPEKSRQSIDDLFNLKVVNNKGVWIPLVEVATIESRYVTQSIRRFNGKKTTFIRGNVDKEITTPNAIIDKLNKQFIPDLKQKYPSLEIALAGGLEQEGELKGGMIKAFLMSLLAIYAFLAIPLKSYSKPLIIMSVIPFGFAGAVIGHQIMGVPVSLLSFFGMLALSGIVVNDSLVMLTRFNQSIDEGMPFDQALIDAGSSRFRAIFLTTVTTVVGLTPLLMETSEQAQYLIPAAVSLVFGELFATIITLVVVPVITHIFADLHIINIRTSAHKKQKTAMERLNESTVNC